MKNSVLHPRSQRSSIALAGRVKPLGRQHASGTFVAVVAAFGLLNSVGTMRAQAIAGWTFETSQPSSRTGSYAPEVNNSTGTPAATISIGTASTVSSPAGNGSAHSFSANNWTTGSYFQFTLSTIGFTNIGVSYDQGSSSTGPRDFQLSYSTDGTMFNTASAYTLANANFAGGTTINPAYTHTYDFSTDSSLNNAANITFRITDLSTTSTNAGTVAATGTDRLDNFTVSQVPEPTTIVGSLLLVGAAGWTLRRRWQTV